MDNEIKYTLEDGTEIDDQLLNTTDTTVLEEFEFTGKSGKKYKGDDSVAVTADKTSGKKATIVKNGKTYRYVRTDVEQTGTVGAKDATRFNDVTAKATVQGMHRADGSIDYSKIKGRVWLIEEKEDGTYGKFKLIENGVGLTDEKVAELSKEATGTFSQAEVDKLGGMKDTDTVMVYETNTYAAVKKEKHAIHDLLMTWGYSGGYSNAVEGGLSLDIPGITKDSSGNYYYKGIRLVNFLKDTDKLMSDSTELDVYKDILLGKDESLLKNIGYFGNSPEVYRDHLFSRWMLARNMDLAKKIENGDYRDTGLSETTDGKPLNETTFSNLDGYRETESVDKTRQRMVDSLYTPENMQALITYLDNLSKADELYWHGSGTFPEPLQKLIEEAKKTPTVTYWKKLLASFDDQFHEPLFRSNVHGDVYTRVYNDPEMMEVVDEFLSQQGMLSMTNDGKFVGVAQVFNVNETSTFWDKYPKAKAYINKYGKRVFNEKIRPFVISPVDNIAGTYDDASLGIVTSDQSGVIYRPYGNGILQKTETFTYHDQVTPLRAYRLNSDKTIIRHVYEEVKKARVTANYYKDGTIEKLADSEILPEQEIGSTYTTAPKVIDPIVKMTKDGDTLITTKTIWTLKEVPADKDGTVPTGGKEVNYYYVKREEVMEVPKPVEPPVPTRPSEPTAPQDLSPAPTPPQSPTEPNPLGNEPRVPVKPNEPTSITPIGEAPVKPTEPLAPINPTLPNQPVTVAPKEPVTPTEPQPPVKPGQPSIGDEPKAPSLRKPVEPTKPIAPAEPKQPVAPTMPIAPRKSIGDANDPSAPEYPLHKPTEPIAPVVPRKPNEPTLPTGPSKPSEPVIPVLPAQPSLPKAPGEEPRVPASPTPPTVPTKPMEPVLPEQPKVPETPQELPTEPVQPRVPTELPTQPLKPEEPSGRPSKPVPPKEPTQPVVAPIQPAKPKELPEEPSKPAQPKVLPETGDASLASLGLLAGLSGIGALRRKRQK